MKMGFKEIKNYLDSFINYERHTDYIYTKDMKLKRVKRLFGSLHIPYEKLKVIHIAGTKGKGSSAIMVAYILAKQGFRVGLYTSPHFIDLRERIRILENRKKRVLNTMIPKREVVRIISKFRPCLERMRFTREFGKVTFFEVYTALALRYFLESNLDYVVLEVGLGGRFDATNVVKPVVSLITHIGYDHTQKLGRRLQDIARQKAGIIKKKVAVVSSCQRREVQRVIYKRAKETEAPLYVLKRFFPPSTDNMKKRAYETFYCYNIKTKRKYTHFDFSYKNFVLKNISLSLKGIHQVDNASLAIMATYLITGNKNTTALREALKEVHIEGRFEVVNKNPLVLVDIAHNPSSFMALNRSLKTYFPNKKVILIFGASSDKDIKKMLALIEYDKLIVTSFNNPRSFKPEEIIYHAKVKADIATNLKGALKRAYAYYNRKYIIVISGSFFLVAEAKQILKRNAVSRL